MRFCVFHCQPQTFVSHVSGGGREPSWGGVRQRNLEGNQEQIPGEKAHRFH